MRRPHENPTMTRDQLQHPEARRMGLVDGTQSRARYAEREWRGASHVTKQQEQVSSAAERTVLVWWQGNRYDILGEDGHSLPLGVRLRPRQSATRGVLADP